MVDTGDAAEVVAVHDVDVAVGRGGGGAQPPRHALQHLIELEGGAELEAGVDQQAQSPVRRLQLLEQRGVLAGVGDELTHIGEEVDVLGIVAFAVVEDLEQSDRAVIDRQRYQDLAPRAGDHQRPARLERFASAGRLIEIERLVGAFVVTDAVLVSDEAAQGSAAEGEHPAAGGADHIDDARAQGADQVVEATGARDRLPERDEFGQSGVATFKVGHQEGVLNGSCGSLPDAAQKVEVLGIVARTRVEDVDDADDPLADHQRDA